MSLAEIEKQHKLIDENSKIVGELETVYKCFDAKFIAELFKEIADDEEFPDAKLRL
ncbi:4041_t:CDS:2 [Funneliformis caledonium]|uniref:4041_t:CDS:1 n=1 Tax=Funneliformis caledonium TaxID=1117310 RepID=A0A9N9CCI4_9GLOM|nr:4041_t:CDS:2 [Funneliformis caledonium]